MQPSAFYYDNPESYFPKRCRTLPSLKHRKKRPKPRGKRLWWIRIALIHTQQNSAVCELFMQEEHAQEAQFPYTSRFTHTVIQQDGCLASVHWWDKQPITVGEATQQWSLVQVTAQGTVCLISASLSVCIAPLFHRNLNYSHINCILGKGVPLSLFIQLFENVSAYWQKSNCCLLVSIFLSVQ